MIGEQPHRSEEGAASTLLSYKIIVELRLLRLQQHRILLVQHHQYLENS